MYDLVYTLDGLLLLIAVTSLLAITLLAVRERLRDFGAQGRRLDSTPGRLHPGLAIRPTAMTRQLSTNT
jgi:hypothetical protein